MKLFELGKQIQLSTWAVVCICQPIRRLTWHNFTEEEGPRRIQQAMEFLQAVCQGTPIIFWKHKGMWNSRANVYRDDGVHLNDLGNFKFYRSIRGLIIHATNKHLSVR